LTPLSVSLSSQQKQHLLLSNLVCVHQCLGWSENWRNWILISYINTTVYRSSLEEVF